MDNMTEADFMERERLLWETARIIPGKALPSMPPKAEWLPAEVPAIVLSDEQSCIVEESTNLQVARISSEIEEEREATIETKESRRIIQFPFAGSAPGHAIRDSNGHWTVVSGPPPDGLFQAAI
jgi:uncharacterized SAM-dependent methyltransferase